jgi:NAD(P)-dependent dehydrogenase (short-subunit alcohol dehydrogenase family)
VSERSQDGWFEGKVAVITGGGSGIGLGTAKHLASLGSRVVVADVSPERSVAAAHEITDLGGEALGVPTDVAEESQVMALVAATLGAFGRLDFFDNNAAATGPAIIPHDTDVARMDVAVWDRTMAVNVRGHMLGCKHAVRAMLGRGGGGIVNTSSGSGLHGDMGRTAYGTSKAAIIGLTRYVAVQYGRDGIRCNAIIPRASRPPDAPAPPTPPPGTPPAMPPSVIAAISAPSREVLGRRGLPLDVARAVAFLFSEESSWITGEVLHVDGGAKIAQPWWPVSREAYEAERGQ